MSKRYLIIMIGTTLYSAEQTPIEIINKAQAQSINIPSTLIMKEDESGNLSAGIIITADLQGNAATATHAAYAAQALCAEQANTFSEPLAGDVTGNQTSTVVTTVGGQTAEQVAAAVQKVYAASAAHIPSTLLMRDEQGNCAVNIITADLQGNAATATYATQAGHVDRAVQADKALTADQATHALQSDKATYAENSGNAAHADQATRAEYASQADKATQALQSDASLRSAQSDCAACAHTFTEPLAGDVVGNQQSTIVTSVGGQSAAAIAAATQKVEQASSDYTSNTLVYRDAKGDFSARNIKATLLGNATTASHANTFNKPLDGDVVGKQFNTVVTRVGGQLADAIATATQTVHAAAAIATPTTLIMRDAQGDFAAHVISADLHGNADTATHALQADKALHADTSLRSAQAECAACASIFTEPLAGDVTGNQNSTVITTIAGQSAEQIVAATQVVQAATASATPATLVMRDDAGNFEMQMITLHGAVTNPTDVATKHYVDTVITAHVSEQQYVVPTQIAYALKADHALSADTALQSDTSLRSAQAECAACAGIFTEPLVGDVTGTQNATVVTAVGGYTAAAIAAAIQKIETTSFEAKPITIITDGGNAIPKAGMLAIRGGQNLKVRGSDSSVVISLAPSPSVTGSLTAGTTITAGTGLQVVSGGAAITGDTKINIAGSGSTTIGNPASTTIYNGPLCLKHVRQGTGVSLGIDDEGNVVTLSFGARAHYTADKKLYALLQSLVTAMGEHQKRIESIESLVCKQ